MTGRDIRIACLVCTSLFVVYNANGREIGSYDSQPTKFAARELLLRGTLSLNHVVGRVPELAERSGFVLAKDGRYRSAYSPVPAVAAAAIAWPLWTTGIVDIRAPAAPNLIAVLAASLLTAISAALAYLTARRTLAPRAAVLLAIGLGMGTGLWSTVSQTLWQHETAIFGLSLAVFAFTRPALDWRAAIATGAGLALAGASRPQLAPVVLVLLAGVFVRAGLGRGMMALAPVALGAGALVRANLLWHGHPLGAAPMLESLHETVHATSGSFTLSASGLGGLLVSPSRGLLIFCPVVLVALSGIAVARRDDWRGALPWIVAGCAAQYALYGSYSVWWGGHTYGPRYMLDLLPLLVPAAALAMSRLGGSAARGLGAAALAWSVAAAGTGAFCYPHDQWNTDPASVDRFHERLWDWSDPQIVRCWTRGMSPQNFNLFSRESFRVVE